MTSVKTLQRQAYESLKQMILNGHFKSSQIYSETKTSKDLGISRTPMRAAIQKLEKEGYLDVIPSKGFCIHKMTEKDLLETYQVRCALEGFCAVNFAHNYKAEETQALFKTLDELLNKMDIVASTTEDIEEFAEYDAEFHRKLVHSINNESLAELFDAYYYRMSRQTIASLHTEGRLKQTVIEHRAVLDCMKSGDVENTYMTTLMHIGQAKTLIKL